MASMKRPAFTFYPGDWLHDAAVRSVSLAARGLWIDMICIMHQANPYGHLVLNGKDILPTILARILGVEQKDIMEGLQELELSGVFRRDDAGVIYSPRMVRDEQIRI
jgi:hypothetical protein